MYSLVSAPVLGFDLTRILGGSDVADVLNRALALHADDLAVLAAQRLDDGDRAQLWAEVEIATAVQPTVRDVAGLSKAVEAGIAADAAASAAGQLPQGSRKESARRANEALTLLQRAPLGTVDALLSCVRYDILDWTWHKTLGDEAPTSQSETASAATAVLCDAIVAGYLRAELDPAVSRRLATSWLAAIRRLPERPVGLGPTEDSVRALLTRVRNLSAPDSARLFKAAEAARRDSASWAPAIHSASWAVHLAGRVREAAAAQFLLVQAVETSGIPVTERAAGVWNLLSGAMQALAARDLVDAGTAHRLLGPVLATLGPSALG